MSDLFHVSSSPHVRSKDTSSRIMLYVVLALLPAAGFGVYNFGYRALVLILVTVATCVASEWAFEKIVHKKSAINDFSAVVTGLLLALNLPATLPCARCFLLIAFAADMTNFVIDEYTGATPLAAMRAGESVNTFDMLIGKTAGTIGETSVIAIVIGAIFLILMGVIDLRIPGTYIITFVLFILLFSGHQSGHGFDWNYITAQLCGGGLMLGAFFMATDYVTSPITPKGKLLFGVCLGILTGLFRMFGANAEGVSFAIILSNLFVPMIEKITIPKAFGQVKEGK